MSKTVVLVGPRNTAGNAMYVAKALRICGIKAESFSYKSHPFGYTCDHENILFKNPFSIPAKRNFIQKIFINKYTLRLIWTIQKNVLFLYTLVHFNTYIFISHYTFFKNNKDLQVLKLFNKKIAFLFVGCPERDPKDYLNYSDRGFCSFCVEQDKQRSLKCYNGDYKKRKIEYISNYANIVFSHKDTISFIQDKYKIRKFYCITDTFISYHELLNKHKSDKEIVICHFPSNKILKETESVVKAIGVLQKRGYKFIFINDRVEHSKINAILKESHILIDQFSFGHGLLGVEGMANGCIVICRVAKWFKQDFPELPLISCEPEELIDVLIDLMSNRENMLYIALKSYEYSKKYHTPEVVGEYYKKTLGLH